MTDAYDLIKQEYEDFTYMVSHDLNGPLRRLREFGNLFLEEHESDLSEKDKLYIHFMQTAISQLEDMQTALLELSRVNTRANSPREVDCNELVEKIQSEYSGPEFDVSIECGQLPKVFADKDQLYRVFQILIDNACKFHKEGGNKECRILGDDRIDHFMFQVKDNGIGIPETFHEDVFKVFRHLHDGKQYKGVGAGLAIARKIINRHGGQIWIDSVPGEGTTVLFTLPR